MNNDYTKEREIQIAEDNEYLALQLARTKSREYLLSNPKNSIFERAIEIQKEKNWN